MTGCSLEDARRIALDVHRHQVDKLGVPYMGHVEAVAAGLVDFDLDQQVAAMLHDVVEDSLEQTGRQVTLDDLRAQGVAERSLAAIELVSRNLHPDLSYAEGIERIATSRDATLVKISDNAHNSLPHRVEALRAAGVEPNPRYAEARRVLFAAVPRVEVERVLERANPALLAEL